MHIAPLAGQSPAVFQLGSAVLFSIDLACGPEVSAAEEKSSWDAGERER